MRRVIVHIDELVLRGFAHEDRRAIAAGIEQELARRLAEPGAAERLGRVGYVDRLRIGNVEMGADAKPTQVGIATAQGVTRGLLPGKGSDE